MRPSKTTGAHVSDRLAELVCSNSLGSKLPDRATGILQNEMRMLGSLLIRCAQESAVPAGGAWLWTGNDSPRALPNDLTRIPESISGARKSLTLHLDQPTIVASGPLTSPALSEAIGQLTGEDYLYFYDAISPIVQASSIDMSRAFQANRYGRGEDTAGDYINCPMTMNRNTIALSRRCAICRDH